MSKKIIFGLSVSEIDRAIKELQEYQNSLDAKCQQLCERLCNEGIKIAQAHIGSSGFGKYIRLSSEITPEKAGCRAILIMEDSQKIVSKWQNQDGVQSKEISPALMLEFGAGLPAQIRQTFREQEPEHTARTATNRDGGTWIYKASGTIQVVLLRRCQCTMLARN